MKSCSTARLPTSPPAEAISFLLERLRRTDNNEEFLDSMKAGE